MKIKKLFNWLYAILMFMPVFNVVAFTIRYGWNYNYTIPSVSQAVSKEVVFNQLINPESYISGQNSVSTTFDNTSNITYINGTSTNLNYSWTKFYKLDNIQGHKYLFSLIGDFTDTASQRVAFCDNTYQVLGQCNASNNYLILQNFVDNGFNICVGTSPNVTYNMALYINVFDLSEMFGVGSEPSIEDFKSFFPESYYEYTVGYNYVIPDYDFINVSDDVTNHFWLPDFGGLGKTINDVVNYLISNIFGLIVVNGIGLIISKLFTYWLIISIVWLVFDLIMYVPLLVHRWIDKGGID